MKFDIEKCGYCGACISVCPNSSLELMENKIIVEDDKCDDCGRCTSVCPLGALVVEVEGNSQNFRNIRNKVSMSRNSENFEDPKNQSIRKSLIFVLQKPSVFDKFLEIKG